jgi:hypothetical protein
MCFVWLKYAVSYSDGRTHNRMKQAQENAYTYAGCNGTHRITAESQLSEITGTQQRSDNLKCQTIQKTNKKDKGKYQLNL